MKDTVILLRVSSIQQDNEAQRYACVEYCKEHDLNVVAILESHESAFKNTMEDLSNIQTILKYAEDGLINNLVFFKADRIGRSVSFISFFEQMNDFGITLHSVNEGILKAENSMDLLQIVLRLFAGQSEAEATSARVKNAIESYNNQTFIDENGEEIETVISGTLPYGCKYESTGIIRNPKKNAELKRVVLDEETAPIIRKMYDFYLYKNWGSHKIANWLNNNNIATPKKRGKWTSTTVIRVLKNPAYIGKIRYNVVEFVNAKSKKRKKLPESEWKYKHIEGVRIITDEEYEQVMEMAKSRKTRKGAVANRGSDNVMLDNLSYCKYCGTKMNITSSKKFNKIRGEYRMFYYVCKNGINDPNHPQVSYSAGVVDELVTKRLKDVIKKHVDNNDINFDLDKHNDKILSRLQQETTNLKVELSDKEQELSALELELPKTLTGKSDYSPKLLSKLITSTEEEITRLKSELLSKRSELKRVEGNVKHTLERLEALYSFDNLWDKADTLDDKKSLIKAVVKRVELSKGEVNVILNLGA